MIKLDEIQDHNSCINRALPDEMTFVLLGRDAAAPAAVREWVDIRVRTGKNERTDPQMVEALQAADIMDAQRDEIRKRL